MPAWELYPRWAEQPLVTIFAKDHAEAERQAAQMALEGRVSQGYLPGGALTPVEER